MKLNKKHNSLQYSQDININKEEDIQFLEFIQSDEFDPNGCNIVCFIIRG